MDHHHLQMAVTRRWNFDTNAPSTYVHRLRLLISIDNDHLPQVRINPVNFQTKNHKTVTIKLLRPRPRLLQTLLWNIVCRSEAKATGRIQLSGKFQFSTAIIPKLRPLNPRSGFWLVVDHVIYDQASSFMQMSLGSVFYNSNFVQGHQTAEIPPWPTLSRARPPGLSHSTQWARYFSAKFELGYD